MGVPSSRATLYEHGPPPARLRRSTSPFQGEVNPRRRRTPRPIETLTVTPDNAGTRLDRVLAEGLPALSRTRLKALILDGAVTVERAHHPRSGLSRQIGRSAQRQRAAAGAGGA